VIFKIITIKCSRENIGMLSETHPLNLAVLEMNVQTDGFGRQQVQIDCQVISYKRPLTRS